MNLAEYIVLAITSLFAQRIRTAGIVCAVAAGQLIAFVLIGQFKVGLSPIARWINLHDGTYQWMPDRYQNRTCAETDHPIYLFS